MTTLEELQYRLACCEAETGTGWGEVHSLRNFLQCKVEPRLYELDPFVAQINRLPEDDCLRQDCIVQELLEEHRELAKGKRMACLYLDITEAAERVEPVTETKAERHGRLRTCLRQLGFPT